MAVAEKIIENSDFLLQFQKDTLIKQFEEHGLVDMRVAHLTFLDEVFRKLLGKGINDTLSAQERREVDYVLDDMVGKIDD